MKEIRRRRIKMKNVMRFVLAGLLVGTGFFIATTLHPGRARAKEISGTSCHTGMIKGFYVYSVQSTIISSPPFPPSPAVSVGGFRADGHGNLLQGQDHANIAGTPPERTFSGTIAVDASCSTTPHATRPSGHPPSSPGM